MPRYTILEGTPFELKLADGAILTLSPGGGAVPIEQVAAGGKAVVMHLKPRRYWLATRATADAAPVRAGVLDVEPLADEREVRLRAEVEALEAEVAKTEETLRIQEGNEDSGVTRTRVTLASLRKQRANAETRLGNYRRRCAGLDPVRVL